MTAGKLSAHQKIALSRLDLTQRELMGDDVGITHLSLQMASKFQINLTEAILDAQVERTIEGASTVTITVLDRDRKLLRSGRLAKRTDLKIDGLWFRLVSVEKNGDNLILVFEDREIAVLRTYATKLKAGGQLRKADYAARDQITRAQFVLRLIQEVKEFKIPWVIPELEIIQPLEADKQGSQPLGGNDPTLIVKGHGIPHGAGLDTPRDILTMHQYAPPGQKGLRVKGARMTNAQIDVANAVLDCGVSMKCTWGELVMSMMCAIQESTMRNLRGGDLDSVGVFQQRRSQGWPASRNITRDARAFFESLQAVVKRHPNYDFAQKIQAVQISAYPDAYRQWRQEAENIVEVYGVGDTNAVNSQTPPERGQNPYHFYRGVPPSQGTMKWGRENSWHCITRLADEVDWRTFFVSGTFYFVNEGDLFGSKPAAILTEDTPGIDLIDGEYDIGKKASELTVNCHIARWVAPPGSVVLVRGMGPFNGRWLVNDVSRSLFSSLGTITLKKPRPALPEPIGDTAANLQDQDPLSPTSGHPKDPAVGPPLLFTGDLPTAFAGNAAQKLLHYHSVGKYRDDNGRQIAQLKKIANGQMLTNQCGSRVHMNPAVLNALVYLIEEENMWVGTFAFCEDHSCNDGQHPKGQACDISSLGSALTGWRSLNTPSSQGTALAKRAMTALRPAAWDLICNGVGRYDKTVQALQMDNNHPRGGVWESDHTNHIHFGVVPGRSRSER
jgi:hypothetical protein